MPSFTHHHCNDPLLTLSVNMHDFSERATLSIGHSALGSQGQCNINKNIAPEKQYRRRWSCCIGCRRQGVVCDHVFLGLSAQSVLSFWICSSVAPMTPSRSFEVWGNRAFVSRKNSCFAACAVNISLMWSASCEIGGQCVVLLWCFLKRLCNVSGPEILLRENGSLSQCVCAHTVFVRVDNISIKPSKVCAQNWHDGTIRTRVFVGWRFVAMVFFLLSD